MDEPCGDPHDLERFVEAQHGSYAQALAELRSGHKTTHWMWFVLPQLAALGRSRMAVFYGLRSLEDARAYWQHPVLGPRLEACVRALNRHAGTSAVEILGPIDAMKFRSCATLFREAAGPQSVFDEALQNFFDGAPDAATLALVRRSRNATTVRPPG